jgi:hypothetical protein
LSENVIKVNSIHRKFLGYEPLPEEKRCNGPPNTGDLQKVSQFNQMHKPPSKSNESWPSQIHVKQESSFGKKQDGAKIKAHSGKALVTTFRGLAKEEAISQ